MLSLCRTAAIRCAKASKTQFTAKPSICKSSQPGSLARSRFVHSSLSARSSLLLSKRYYTTPSPNVVEESATQVLQSAPGTQAHDMLVQDGGALDPAAWQAVVEANRALVDEVMIPVTPETLAVHMWLMLQHDLGVPLWCAMALTTWGLRTVALPIFFAQVRNMAALSLIQPRIQAIKYRIEEQSAKGDEVMISIWEEKLATLYKAFEVAPWKNFSNSLVIVPIMLAQAFSARYMLEHTPHLLEQAGPLWLSNLNVVDPLYITPAIYIGLQLLIMRLNIPMQSGITGPMNLTKGHWALLAAYSGVLTLICTSFPAAISSLWIYSMSFTAVSNAAMYLPAIRRRLGIATSLPTERPSHLPPIIENPVKKLVHQELLRAKRSD